MVEVQKEITVVDEKFGYRADWILSGLVLVELNSAQAAKDVYKR